MILGNYIFPLALNIQELLLIVELLQVIILKQGEEDAFEELGETMHGHGVVRVSSHQVHDPEHVHKFLEAVLAVTGAFFGGFLLATMPSTLACLFFVSVFLRANLAEEGAAARLWFGGRLWLVSLVLGVVGWSILILRCMLLWREAVAA